MKAVGAVQIGKHIDAAGKHFAAIMTQCLHDGVSPELFEDAFNAALDFDGEEDLQHALISPFTIIDGEEVFWGDCLEQTDAIQELYTLAVTERCNTCIAVCDNAFVSLVALRGDPGLPAILQCLADSEDVPVIMTSPDDTVWPVSVQAHAPIAYIWTGHAPLAEVTLRDGTIVFVE